MIRLYIYISDEKLKFFVVKIKSKQGLRFKGNEGHCGDELVNSIYELRQVQINDKGCMYKCIKEEEESKAVKSLVQLPFSL